MSVLSERLGAIAMRVCCTPPGAKWPATIWEVYAPQHLGGTTPNGYRRSIAAANDGGRWVFFESGAPYPFEKADHYALPRKRDRFTRELLIEYLGQFRLHPHSLTPSTEASHQCPAVLLENQTRWLDPAPELTLKAQAGLPWKRT